MSFSNNEDYDLCWHYLSSTDCRHSNCTWRHQSSADRFCQEYFFQTRDNGISYQEDPSKTWYKPVYPIKHHQDVGVNDKYGLILSPHMDKKDRSKRRFQFGEKRGYLQESEHTSLKSTPMNVGFHRTNASNVQMSMGLMSLGESDPEGDPVKNYVINMFADIHGELKIPRRRIKRKWLSGKKFTSSFSPFAKVFVPRKSIMSKDGISAGLNEMTLENRSVNTIQQSRNLKSYLTENDVVFE